MDTAAVNKDWKSTLGFPINYDSGPSSDDDFDTHHVVMPPHPRRSTGYLLADRGDGSEADLLGTTPPRTRIRDKEKKRSNLDNDSYVQIRVQDRDVKDVVASPIKPGRHRTGLKLIRAKERDWKDTQWESKADSLPSPNPLLVESCSRFMSLSSTLKCRDAVASTTEAPPLVEERRAQRPSGFDEAPESRVNFHNTFSMLINMGNIEKGCRRAISREEQVWQNELKDLIWLELQAKLGGRTLAQQDTFLCTQRRIVPALVQSILEYRFVNKNPCRGRERRLCVIAGSREDLADHTDHSDTQDSDETNDDADESLSFGCLALDCTRCAEAVGAALREVGALLDSFSDAEALYPSSKAMTVDNPLVATPLFKNRLKAMCQWYNIALHMRLKVLAVRRMLRSLRRKDARRLRPIPMDPCSYPVESSRLCQVRFSISNNTTDSSNSESSSHENNREERESGEEAATDYNNDDSTNEIKQSDEIDCGNISTPECNGEPVQEQYSTNDTSVSAESGYASNGGDRTPDDPLDVGSLQDLTALRLLGKCEVSPYRSHHNEILKTQGVRRCMMFIHKMRRNVLTKVLLTFQRLDALPNERNTYAENDPTEVFVDTKDDEEKVETSKDKDAQETKDYELRRYGCWSEECLAMRLPSYRNHFLLLSTICMEAVHDYLTLRLEGRPDKPSCLTVKQLIHELKEGLDIATDMRAAFVRILEVALLGARAGAAARSYLQLVIRTFDTTVETVLKQYLSYLQTMSVTEHMSRSCLESEWSFTARLAKRVKCAALLAPVCFTDIACNQLARIESQFQLRLKDLLDVPIDTRGADFFRYEVYALCRTAQHVFASEREATLHAAHWARQLAGRLARAPPSAAAAQRLRLYNSLMSIRNMIVKTTLYILETSREHVDVELTEQVGGRIRELLLQVYRLGFEIHKELHRVVNDSTWKLGARGHRKSVNIGRPKFLRSESVGEESDAGIFDDIFVDNQTSIELLLLDEKTPREAETVSAECEGGEGGTEAGAEAEWAVRVGRAVVEFARCWMKFVMERCDRGRGLRPRWASQGLEFLMLACDPCNTKHLTDEEFEELKQLMDECISHVIGSRPSLRAPDTPALTSRRRLPSPMPSNCHNSTSKDVPPPSTPPTDSDPLMNFHQSGPTARRRRVQEAIQEVDRLRDERLREMKAVGHVLEEVVSSYEPKLRQVTFKWQRGLKIGAGTFGKVYTVVNTETGQLLAMKELGIGAGDRRALQKAANELRVLEGVIHPHLVRYHGCEVHREEMLIFMELCVEGSLEALVASSGALAEHTTRRYTKQLVSAVLELHNRNIAHRDIKSGNIFLTNEGHCLKLGDFGCAVKIRGNTTAAGELQGCVGTQAYMAPEVFMKSSGHGRAADIWSLGCVVTEMASGTRPFSEYDSNYQIMFVVGMGGRPRVPETLSAEGADFCLQCLTHDVEHRPRAEALSLHHFLMVKSDDDCQCQPAYLLA